MRTALILLAWVGVAHANPFFLGRYGGLRDGPTDESTWALYWNPAGLARPGARVGLHVQGARRVATYDRPEAGNFPEPEDDPDPVNTGENRTVSQGLAPALAGGYGFALGDLDIGFGLGVYAAQAGVARWEKTLDASTEHPGAVDGPQRWGAINTQMIIISYASAIGTRYRPWGLSIGVSPVYTRAQLSTVRARVPNKRQVLRTNTGELGEGRILLEDATDDAVRLVVGLRWDPRDDLSTGLTWHQGHTYTMRGEAHILFGTAPETTPDARLNLPVADIVRLGSRIDAYEWLSLRPSVEWGNWSVMKRQIAVNEANGADLIVIEREFEDTLAVHLRADVKLTALTLHLGGGYETGATPEKTHEPGLAESDNWQLGAGVSFGLSEHVGVTLGYIFHQFLDVTVDNSIQQPRMNGRYTDQRHYATVDLEVRL